MAPLPSRVRFYTLDEIEDQCIIDKIAKQAETVLGFKPFSWQLELASTVLEGRDIIVDVGTGGGKTLCFSLPLLLHEQDISLIVSPLSALMVDQVQASKIPAIAICQETFKVHSRRELFQNIANGIYRQIFVSPEIATSKEFRDMVLSKASFYHRLRVVFIDEAHCISFWGGTFRADYDLLGHLRARLPSNVPVVPVSATLPAHIQDDIRTKLQISPDTEVIAVTNARPNIALSVRAMSHSHKSKADLRFVIPHGVKNVNDIPIQLIYVNSRIDCEDVAEKLQAWLIQLGLPADCSGYYHAKIGSARKHELEEKLRKGEVRILACTDAVGMGCDMRNIMRVTLWGLPPSFCALIQRIGRAVRDLTQLGEAVLIVPAKVIKGGLKKEDIEAHLNAARKEMEAGSTEQEPETGNLLASQRIQITEGNQRRYVTDGGTRVAQPDPDDGMEVDGEDSAGISRRRKRKALECSSKEARFLSEFVSTTACRRVVWDRFFRNHLKQQLTPVNSTFRPIANARCCDNCQPDQFPLEVAIISGPPTGLKRGRKRTAPKVLEEAIRKRLLEWRVTLFKEKFPAVAALLSPEVMITNDVIDQLATCGDRITSPAELRRHTRWPAAFLDDSGTPSRYGMELVVILGEVYRAYEEQVDADRLLLATRPSLKIKIPAAQFYGTATFKK